MLKINISKLLTLLLPLFLIMAQYKFSVINLGFVLFQVIAFLIVISHTSLTIQKSFFLFFISIFISLFCSIIIYKTLYHGTLFYYLNGLTLFVVVVAFSAYINPSKLYDWYLICGVFITAIVLAQGSYMIVTGTEVSPIKLLPTPVESERLWHSSPRPSAFFTEPQLYASFILPLFLLSVLKKHFKFSFLFLLGIIISGSTYGFLVVAALALWLLVKTGRLTSVKAWFGLIFFSSILILAFLLTGLFDNTIEKLARTDLTQGIRVAKAPLLFWEMSPFEKLFGMKGTVEDFIRQNISAFPFLLAYVEADSHLLGYITGLFGLAIFFGIIPMLLFLWMLVNAYQNGDKFQQGMSIIILMHSISATILFNGYFVFFFILLFANSYDGTSKLKYWKFS